MIFFGLGWEEGIYLQGYSRNIVMIVVFSINMLNTYRRRQSLRCFQSNPVGWERRIYLGFQEGIYLQGDSRNIVMIVIFSINMLNTYRRRQSLRCFKSNPVGWERRIYLAFQEGIYLQGDSRNIVMIVVFSVNMLNTYRRRQSLRCFQSNPVGWEKENIK